MSQIETSPGDNLELNVNSLRGRGFWKEIRDDKQKYQRLIRYMGLYWGHKLMYAPGEMREFEDLNQKEVSEILRLQEAIAIFGSELVRANHSLVSNLDTATVSQKTQGIEEITSWENFSDARGQYADFLSIYQEINRGCFGKTKIHAGEASLNYLFHSGEAILKFGFNNVIEHARTEYNIII